MDGGRVDRRVDVQAWKKEQQTSVSRSRRIDLSGKGECAPGRRSEPRPGDGVLALLGVVGAAGEGAHRSDREIERVVALARRAEVGDSGGDGLPGL